MKPGMCAKLAANEKTNKYTELAKQVGRTFIPVSFDTAGAMYSGVSELANLFAEVVTTSPRFSSTYSSHGDFDNQVELEVVDFCVPQTVGI